MTEDARAANPMFTNPLVHQLPFSGVVREDISYGEESRVFDLYLPEQIADPVPVVVLITGYPDPGFQNRMGLRQKEIQCYKDWARLLAANGMAAVIYSNIDPVEDALTLLEYLRSEAGRFQLDSERIALWSCSGNVPNAINALYHASALRCAVFLYGFMLDTEESSLLKETAQTFGFVNPHEGMQKFPENTPILIIRAGRDEFPGLNESIDNFEAEAIARNSPVSVVRFPEGVHAFDTLDASQRSIEMIKLCVGFLRLRLSVY